MEHVRISSIYAFNEDCVKIIAGAGVKDKHHRVWLEVNLATIQSNYNNISRAVSPCEVVAVLKANAYGLGVLPVANALKDAGAPAFAVAELNEALELSELECPVQILGSVLPAEIGDAIAAGIILPVPDVNSALLISAEAERQGRQAVCHLLVDTGMGRLGLLPDDLEREADSLLKLPFISYEGIYSHFPMAYQPGSEYTLGQIERFCNLLTTLASRGIDFRYRHIANSDAVNNFPESYAAPFNRVRTGINLHGSFDSEGERVLDLKPALKLKTFLLSVRELPAGTSLGYGCTYRLPRRMRVGVISAGYADGLPLALSNRGSVEIRGAQCSVLGRISMDYASVALDQAPDADVGDEVTCLGGEGFGAASVDDWARLKGTHAYEIICSFGSRVARVYVNGEL